MKIIFTTTIAAALFASIGAASARQMSDQTVRNYYQALAPSTQSGVMLSGRSAYIDRFGTDHVYGIGRDGQGVLAPHINGIF